MCTATTSLTSRYVVLFALNCLPSTNIGNDIFNVKPAQITAHAAAAAKKAQLALAAQAKLRAPSPDPVAQAPPFASQYDYASPVKEKFSMKVCSTVCPQLFALN